MRQVWFASKSSEQDGLIVTVLPDGAPDPVHTVVPPAFLISTW